MEDQLKLEQGKVIPEVLLNSRHMIKKQATKWNELKSKEKRSKNILDENVPNILCWKPKIVD